MLVFVLKIPAISNGVTKSDGKQEGDESCEVGDEINHFYLLGVNKSQSLELTEPRVQ